MTTPCTGCGAPREGLFCHYCGVASEDVQSTESELALLAELQRAVAETEDDAIHERILRTAPLPKSGPALFEAIVHLVGILDSEETFAGLGEGAFVRAQTLRTKLRIIGSIDPKTDRAVVELDRAIARYEAARARTDRGISRVLGVGCFVVVLAAVLVYFVR